MVIGLAKVTEDPEATIATVKEFVKSERERSGGEMTESAADDAPETKKADRSHRSETQRQKPVDLLGKNIDFLPETIVNWEKIIW